MAMATAERTTTLVDEEAPPTHSTRRRDRLAIPLLVTATGISNAGNNITAIAIPWFVLVTTGSAARTGVVAAAVAVATTLGGFFGGTFVDRIGFKRSSIVSDLSSGFFVALVPTLYYFDLLGFGALIGLTFMATLLDAPGWSARRSMLPELSGRVGTPLERSNGLMEIAQSGASFVGPLLAGVLISALSAAAVLYLDTASFLVSALIVALAISLPRARRSAHDEATGARSFFHESAEGVRFMARNPLLRAMMVVGVLANLFLTPLLGVAIPVFAKQTFDDARAFGLMVAGFGIGAVAGVVGYSAIGPRVRRYPVFVGGILLGAAALFLLPATTYLWVSIVGTVLMGLGLGPINVITMTVVQEIVPEGLLGRVSGTLGALSQLAVPVGMLLSGVAIEWFGVRPVFYSVAVLFALLIVVAVCLPIFRQIERSSTALAQGSQG